MRKIHIYSIGLVIVGGVMGYYPGIFKSPLNVCLGALFIILFRLIAEKFGKD